MSCAIWGDNQWGYPQDSCRSQSARSSHSYLGGDLAGAGRSAYYGGGPAYYGGGSAHYGGRSSRELGYGQDESAQATQQKIGNFNYM